jgi:mono/diheme cytochrome c family protein
MFTAARVFAKMTVLVLLPGFYGTGCVSIESAAPPVTAVMVAGARVGETTLEQGRDLFVGRCAACHQVYPVANYTVPEWQTIVEDMADRSKLTDQEERAIMAYIRGARVQTGTGQG